MAEKKSFVLYYNWYEYYFREMSDAKAGKLIKAIFEYSIFGIEPEWADNNKLTHSVAFVCIKNQLDRDEEKYFNKCEHNRRKPSYDSESENAFEQNRRIPSQQKLFDYANIDIVYDD